jgi:hypothetical protein
VRVRVDCATGMAAGRRRMRNVADILMNVAVLLTSREQVMDCQSGFKGGEKKVGVRGAIPPPRRSFRSRA